MRVSTASRFLSLMLNFTSAWAGPVSHAASSQTSPLSLDALSHALRLDGSPQPVNDHRRAAFPTTSKPNTNSQTSTPAAQPSSHSLPLSPAVRRWPAPEGDDEPPPSKPAPAPASHPPSPPQAPNTPPLIPPPFRLNPEPVRPLYNNPNNGLYVNVATCGADRAATVIDAIAEAAAMALAAKSTFGPQYASLPLNPASYFFGTDPRYDQFPLRIFDIVADYAADIKQDLPPIEITCFDSILFCYQWPGSAGYAGVSLSNNVVTKRYIVPCRNFFTRGFVVDPIPCAGPLSTDGVNGLGGNTRGSFMLHELSHAVTDNKIADVAPGYGSVASHQLVEEGGDRFLFNADNYSGLGKWAFWLDYDSGFPCLEWFVPDQVVDWM